MPECDRYDPDIVFKRFKIVEFPASLVGLSTTRPLDVEVDLCKSAYLKTTYEGNLLKFEEAREVSSSHRSFIISQVDDHTIQITFHPKNECICNAKCKKELDNRFVIDLHLIQVDGMRCCNNEIHSEIGRYYISGQYEYCKLSHFPKQIQFGDVMINSKVTKHVRIRNESSLIATKIEYVRVTGFEVLPQKFMIPPNATKRISVTIKPTTLKVADTISFRVRNPNDTNDDKVSEETVDENFITYKMTCKLNIIYNKKPREIDTESLHKLNEQHVRYTYINDTELKLNKQRKDIAFKHLQICKSSCAKKNKTFTADFGRPMKCINDNLSIKTPKLPKDFCKKIRARVSTYDLFDILFLPFALEFGRIGLNTYGEQKLTIKNNTKFDNTIKLYNDECVLYTEDKLSTIVIKMKSMAEVQVTIFCLGFVEGNYRGTFEYLIDNKYNRKHPYSLQVETPILMIKEKILKFGMITNESFITSVPIRIYNYFNIPVDFKWNELTSDKPFEIIPISGTIPKHSYKICDVIYTCKPTKTKTHEVDFESISKTLQVVPVELTVINRKQAIKFLQPAVLFKDIPLNLETIERVKLENSSREVAIFYVMEPLIPGLRIEPMSGTIRAKMIITFKILVNISCVLEFAFDIYVKINNKENVILPVSGNVVEPKILIHPKNIFMARIPSDMVTYVPVTFQNLSTLKTLVEVLDIDENVFEVYIAVGNEKQRIFKFFVEGGQSKIVFIKVYDVYRREYEMYIPFKINRMLGPPDQNSWSMELQNYIGQFEKNYENNAKVKIKSINKDISYCRISGVITLPKIRFSVEKFEIEYVSNKSNKINFTMTNVSKCYLYVTILTAKLTPFFSLDLRTEENQSIINETNIQFELDRGKEAELSLKFHPKGHGRFVSTALLFLDKHMTIPYFNLTFVGKRQTLTMTPSTYRVIFPPCYVGTEIVRTITIQIGGAESNMDSFSCMSKEEPNLTVKFISSKLYEEHDEIHTLLTIQIIASCQTTYARNLTVSFNHESGSGCDVEINFCFTYCSLTLHTNFLVKPEDNPYPYFPLSSQEDLYEYLEKCIQFLEKWMFQQGFRRELNPVIPDTFHAISVALSSQPSGKSKGINVSYLNFVKRIAGPLMKHIRKITEHVVDESFKCVKEIHDTYSEILNLMKSRGTDLWVLQARFLLSYEQFVVYSENVTPKCNADITLTRELLEDVNLFDRLTKQSWIDFILQSYKVFVMDSCFFECVCVSSDHRDIVKILIDWYNEHILIQHNKLRGINKPAKVMTNISTDLTDGIALASTIMSYCPYLADKFEMFSEITEDNKEGGIINNACLIIEAMNQLRLYFPLISKDFLQPNFLQMLFLSIHLYVALPMFKPKDIIKFNPPLLRSSTRQLAIFPASQESLIFSYIILNNDSNNFVVEKAPPGDNGKKMLLNVKYIANFVNAERCTLLVHGYNKTRIFDTYVVFLLQGKVGVLTPVKKCKVIGPLYRPNKVDILVSSPFTNAAQFRIYLTDIEPSIPVDIEEVMKPRFYLQRLNLIEKEIHLSGLPKENSQEVSDHKVYLQIICLSTQVGNTWIWFRSDIGDFFIRVTSQPRWDLAIDTLLASVQTWPLDPCSCGEACECYRTTILMIPHRNELMIKSLRYALLEHASETMMNVFDMLIETTTGKIILGMLLTEGGTIMSDVNHILRSGTVYRISSRTLSPQLDRVRLAHHTSAILPVPVTIPVPSKSDKYNVTLTSECGMDIRTYKVLFTIPGEQSDGTPT